MDENQPLSEKPKPCSHWNFGRIIPGSILLFLGIVFLLQNYGIIQGDVWGKLWPIFLIIPGLLILFSPNKEK
jgi:hypothetical protein